MAIKIQPKEFQNNFNETVPQESIKCDKKPFGKVIPNFPKAVSPKKSRVPEIRLIKKYYQEKNEKAMVSTFYTSIVKYAKQKQFTVAERLREKLMEMVPMALSEIVETGDIIENEKNAALDPEKMKPFADLYNQFSKTEATAFFFALAHRDVKANIPVFEQCQFDDQLYFIQAGRFILSYYDCETRQNIDYAILQKGDVAGIETFFSLSSHTSTLTPLEKSTISVLNKNTYESMLRDNPSLESKLTGFCNNRKISCRIDESKRQARRQHQRFPVNIKGQFRKSDAKGRVAREAINITIVDISSGGLCFVMKNYKGLNRNGLHKSWLQITAAYREESIIKEFISYAKVVSLQVLPFDDCSVHVQFRKPVDNSKVMEMMCSDKMTAQLNN